VARDAALRGLSVLLLEAGDLASGTSSRTSKLVHGGIRYLETGQVALVREALRERAILLRTAPEWVRPLPFLIPHYRGAGRSRFRVGVGLALYAALAGRHGIGRGRRVEAAEALAMEPRLTRGGLAGGSLFWDAQMEDAPLCVALALHAESAGARVRSYARLGGLRPEGDGWRAHFADSIEGTEEEASARWVVNAAGPWADRVRAMALGAPSETMRLTRGTHVVLPGLAGERALLLTARRDGRVIFVLPWGRHALVGTTDVDAGAADESGPTPGDVRYLLEEAAAALPAAKGTRPVRAFAGHRSLVRGSARQPWSNTREHRVLEDGSLMTLIGGKYTTHRSLAERIVDRIVARLGIRARPCATAAVPLPRGREAAIQDLRHRFPGRMDLEGGFSLTEAEVVRAVTAEKARRLEDVLLRRTRLWLDGRAVRGATETAASWMAGALGWEDARRRAEVERVLRILDEEERAIEEGMP
jgi:glycerol-3-phosphate dehydrogenase